MSAGASVPGHSEPSAVDWRWGIWTVRLYLQRDADEREALGRPQFSVDRNLLFLILRAAQRCLNRVLGQPTENNLTPLEQELTNSNQVPRER